MHQMLKMHDVGLELLKQPEKRSITKGIIVRETQSSRNPQVIVDYLYDPKAVHLLFTDRELFGFVIFYASQDSYLMAMFTQSLGEIEGQQLGTSRPIRRKPMYNL